MRRQPKTQRLRLIPPKASFRCVADCVTLCVDSCVHVCVGICVQCCVGCAVIQSQSFGFGSA